LKCTTKESSGVVEPSGAEGLHVLFRLFGEFEKQSACRQFGIINQSVKDVKEKAGWRVRARERKKASRREYFSAC